MTTIRTILVPVDFTQGSLAAVVYARDLAATFKSKVHLLHVATPAWAEELVAAHARTLPELQQMRALDQLATLIAALRFDPRTTTGLVRTGCAEHAIASYAAEIHADLIVMGAHGDHSTPTDRVGRVVDRVLSRVHCPVLTIPDPLLEEATFHYGPSPLQEAVAC